MENNLKGINTRKVFCFIQLFLKNLKATGQYHNTVFCAVVKVNVTFYKEQILLIISLNRMSFLSIFIEWKWMSPS